MEISRSTGISQQSPHLLQNFISKYAKNVQTDNCKRTENEGKSDTEKTKVKVRFEYHKCIGHKCKVYLSYMLLLIYFIHGMSFLFIELFQLDAGFHICLPKLLLLDFQKISLLGNILIFFSGVIRNLSKIENDQSPRNGLVSYRSPYLPTRAGKK